jgi:hypothetical protein
MFWEYAQWLGFSPESPITFDFIKEACIVVGSGLLLVFAGFKVKGTLGAVLALFFGAVLYLYLTAL